MNIDLHTIRVGSFSTCIYEKNWWVAEVFEVNSELQEVKVNFMLPHGPATGYHFPIKQHLHDCAIGCDKILNMLTPPVPTASSGRLHEICKSRYSKAI